MTLFRKYKVQPEGRNKYGHYTSAQTVRSNLTYSMYNGNLSTETIPTTGGGNQNTGGTRPQSTFIIVLSSTQGNFMGEEVALSAISTTTKVVSYENSTPICSYIANFADEEDTHSGITGYAESGMTIQMVNNGTSATTLQISVDSSITSSHGVLTIPCYVPNGGEVGMGDSWAAWKTLFDNGDLFFQEVQWEWVLTSNASSSYLLDLTNEIASVNCDQYGNVVPGAILPTTRARLFFGDSIVSGATYRIEIAEAYHASGVSFNTQTGVLSFTSGLSFDGTTMEIPIYASYLGLERQKTFSLNKNIPGGGELAVAKWLLASADQIVFDPNNNTFVPTHVSCKVFKQEGGDEPYEATSAETVWWRTSLSGDWTSGTSLDIQVTSSAWTGVYFALATDDFTIYESEDVPLLANGKNGTSAETPSIYELNLTNDTASVNCDADGNVVSGAVLPTTRAKMYLNDTLLTTGVAYSIPSNFNNSGISINSSGVLSCTSSLHFSGTTLDVPITANYNGVERIKTFSIMKNIPGKDGQSGETAVSKWLQTSVDEIIYDPDSQTLTPTHVSCKVWKQIGGNTPFEITSATTVYWSNDKTNWTSGTNLDVNVSSAWTAIYFGIDSPSNMYEMEEVPIMKNGATGPQGSTGLPGAAVRGPVDWYSGITENRRFCNGRGPNSGDTEFIDILLKDGTYYRCNISYDAHPSDSWSSVSSAWTASDASYNFVATNLLLAENAKIKFLTNNALYLMSGNTITGGAMGGSGNTVAFWAGSSNPNSGNFQVNHNGEITAKKGTFAGYVQMPYTFISDLSHTTNGYIADDRAYLIADSQSTSYGMGDGGMLILPEPSSALNGFTYHIIAWPNWNTKTTGISPSISVMTTAQTASLSVLAYSDPSLSSSYKRLSFYGGHIEITCAPYHYTDRQTGQIVVGYRWIVTMCTGGVDLYSNTGPRSSGTSFVGSYTTLCGFSPNDMYYAPIKVQTEGFSTLVNKSRDTIYIDV